MNTNKKSLRENENVIQHEARCACGHLVAKIRGENLELKCKRCRRIVTIPYSSIKDTECTIVLH